MATNTIGPITPTTPTVIYNSVDNVLSGPFSVTALKNDGWPATFLVTNTGANGVIFALASEVYLSGVDGNYGPVLIPGQSMIYHLDAPGVTQISGNELQAFTFGLGGASTITITGVTNA
jgi:hypothetical protein